MFAANVGLIRMTALALLTVCIVPADTTQAQFLFWPQHRLWWSDHTPRPHEHRQRRTQPELAERSQAENAPHGPLQIIISIADQRISVYDNGALIARSSVSTGIPRHPTPLGIFSVISKQRWHRSNLYSAAPMPYMQRITWSGIALHAGILPGHPASHGCIRLKYDFATRLWHLTKRGTRVIIAADDIRPVEIASPHLFESKPQAASDPPASRDVIMDRAAIATPAVRPSIAPNADADRQAPGSTGVADSFRNVVPISVIVSRKLNKLFVRRDFTQLFDIPIRIQDPEQPLGTHVFTVMGPENEGTLRWTVVSMPERSPRALLTPQWHTPGKHMAEITPPLSSSDKANAALERIQIPYDAGQRISQLLTPGSSIIISDYGFSRETGSDTDFIVETH